MASNRLIHTLRRLWTLDKFAYSLRTFIGLAGVMIWSWSTHNLDQLIPLFLGVLASALAETDDNWQHRALALFVTLICFAGASLSVELAFHHPWIFAPGLGVISFSIIMLGAIGQRYATISFATLILSIYTMINIEQHGGTEGTSIFHGPMLLVIGASWYGLLSILWHALFTHQPVRQHLAILMKALGKYLKIKASLFEPVHGVDREERRLKLAQQNGVVVNALNAAKETLFSRLNTHQNSQRLDRYLRLYFIAQDIHERASSTHHNYGALARAFFHSDVLFRCQWLLYQQGEACRQLSKALLLRLPFDHSKSEQALKDLRASIQYLDGHQPEPDSKEQQRLMRSLNSLEINLTALERQLALADNPAVAPKQDDRKLLDRSPSGLKDAWRRIRSHLRLSSPIFRHAIRLSLALMAGYGLLKLIHPTQGYWIMLTTLFVCRPNFGTTYKYFRQRIIGTMIGLVSGWALISLFPWPMAQAVIAVLAGVFFFATRSSHYITATASITLMVLACFNQVGNGFGLIWPRMFDTLLGALIAALAAIFILPDWQRRRLDRDALTVINNSRDYLKAIKHQYQQGKQDDLAYRLARRNAHNADAAFSTHLNTVLQEPRQYRQDADKGLNLLVITHSILGHLSTLGAHRRNADDVHSSSELDEAFEQVITYLNQMSEALDQKQWLEPLTPNPIEWAERLEALAEAPNDEQRLAHLQLALLCRQMDPMREAVMALARLKPAQNKSTSSTQ